MNWEHLKAILWLRSRLTANQRQRVGTFNVVLMKIIDCLMVLFAALSFFMALGLGIFLLPEAAPMTVLIVWDVLVGSLLFSWSVSLMVDIQRMELFSLDKLLHLPLSLKSAFLLNYLSSLLCLNIFCFFPAAIGLCIALSVTHGPRMLILVPMVMSFLLMLTAVTYQIRGWLASLMSNKRRQRNVVMLLTFSLVAIAQTPNIVMQLTRPSTIKASQQWREDQLARSQELKDALIRQEITRDEYAQKLVEMRNGNEHKKNESDGGRAAFTKYLTLANQVLPIGWLPYSSKSLLAGTLWPAMLCLIGMTLIGAASLRRSYQSTINYYTGNVKAVAMTDAVPRKKKSPWMERTIPYLSEHSTGIALCNICNLLRAPEARMIMIGPMVLGIIFFLMIFSNGTPKIPAGISPLVWLGSVAAMTFMCLIMMLNMFGMDRNGFRCFVLMPVERSEILLGKNVSMLPIFILIGIMHGIGLFYIAPIGLLALVANASQLLSAFFMASMVGNTVSIQLPLAMAPGTGKPAQVNIKTILVHIVVMLLCPIVIIPGVFFFGVEWSLGHFFSINYLPVFALLSAIELWLVYKTYLNVLRRQGRQLQLRETRILELLTTNTE